MTRSIFISGKKYTFSDYFDFNIPAEEVVQELGYSLTIQDIQLPTSTAVDPAIVKRLQSMYYDLLPKVSINSESAKREFLIAPLLHELVRTADVKLNVEYPLNIDEHLSGSVDYLLRASQELVIVEAKRGDLERGFTQLAAELIALDRMERNDSPAVLYGAITIGEVWRFALLERETKTIVKSVHTFRYPEDVAEILAILQGIIGRKSTPLPHELTFVEAPQIDYAAIEESIFGGTVQRRGDTVITRGEGCWLWDVHGKKYLDLTSAQGVAMLGHCHPVLSKAVAEQAMTLISCPSFLYNDTRGRFAAKLSEILPSHLQHVFVANSGAEAMDGALKFAKLTTGRKKFIAARRGFHGRTVGALSVTWDPKYREPFLPLLDSEHVPFNNVDKLDAAINDETAAVVLEVVQAEGGVFIGDPEFLQAAQHLAHERGALLIIDEIQTGFGRTGKWFACEHVGLQPDIITMAKGIGGGFPMGAVAYTDQVQEKLYPGAHGSTFGGNPLACAAGLAAIEIYQNEKIMERAEAMGKKLLAMLTEVIGDYTIVREIRGIGMIVGIELREKVAQFLKALMEDHGVIALPAGPQVLRLLPPLTISEEELEFGVRAIATVLQK